MTSVRLFAISLLVALTACRGGDAGAEGERKTAAGEVLGGTISDDMLPLDTVTSQSPPLREKAEAGHVVKGGPAEGAAPAASDGAPEPSPSATPTPTPTPEAEG